MRAVAWCEERANSPSYPAGYRVPSLRRRSSTASRFVSTLSAATARSSPAGAGISRGLRLRAPVHLATDGFGYLFTSTSRAESTSWPGRGRRLERDRDCRNSAARHQAWGRPRREQPSGGGQGTQPERRGRETAANGERCPVLRRAPRWARRRGGDPGQPGPSPGSLSCRSALKCVPLCRVFFKQATEPFPARVSRPVSPRGSLSPRRLFPVQTGSGTKEGGLTFPAPLAKWGKGE